MVEELRDLNALKEKSRLKLPAYGTCPSFSPTSDLTFDWSALEFMMIGVIFCTKAECDWMIWHLNIE